MTGTVPEAEQSTPEAEAVEFEETLQARLAAAEKDAAELRGERDREHQKVNTLRTQLANARIYAGRLERQIAGNDEAEFDPQKQKGLGAIPVGGPDMTEVEAIEAKLGMSPTMDQQMRQLGMGDVADQAQRLLGEGGAAEYLEVVSSADEQAQLANVLQACWMGRTALKAFAHVGSADDLGLTPSEHRAAQGVVVLALTAIESLPVSLFTRHLDLEDWDELDLPAIKEH
jgi:hypothetical protein